MTVKQGRKQGAKAKALCLIGRYLNTLSTSFSCIVVQSTISVQDTITIRCFKHLNTPTKEMHPQKSVDAIDMSIIVFIPLWETITQFYFYDIHHETVCNNLLTFFTSIVLSKSVHGIKINPIPWYQRLKLKNHDDDLPDPASQSAITPIRYLFGYWLIFEFNGVFLVLLFSHVCHFQR